MIVLEQDTHCISVCYMGWSLLQYHLPSLRKDLNKISNIKLEGIKDLISSFQIIEETYQQDTYKATFKIFYNDTKKTYQS